ncbi:hypothetical protein GT039_09150 [Streptomyces sp. SID2955]|nr:hypothetical protein [Streptomyces sp. SID2955]
MDRGRGDRLLGTGCDRYGRLGCGARLLRGAAWADHHLALGEAIVGVGAGAEDSLGRLSVVTAVLFAVLIAAGLWWSYFGYLRGGAVFPPCWQGGWDGASAPSCWSGASVSRCCC